MYCNKDSFCIIVVLWQLVCLRWIVKRLFYWTFSMDDQACWANHHLSPHAFWFWTDGLPTRAVNVHLFTHSFTALIQPTWAHLAPREKVLSLLNPRLSWGAHSIWWVSKPRSVQSPPLPCHHLSPLIFWLQTLFLFKSQKELDLLGPFFLWCIYYMGERTCGCRGRNVTGR